MGEIGILAKERDVAVRAAREAGDIVRHWYARPITVTEKGPDHPLTRADPLLLRDTYGIVFPGLDYRRLERRWLPRLPRRPAGLSELMHIDTAVQREILAGLLRTRWARADPARGPWIDGLLRDLCG